MRSPVIGAGVAGAVWTLSGCTPPGVKRSDAGAGGSGGELDDALKAETVTGGSVYAVTTVFADAPFRLLLFFRKVWIAANDATSAAVAPDNVKVCVALELPLAPTIMSLAFEGSPV